MSTPPNEIVIAHETTTTTAAIVYIPAKVNTTITMPTATVKESMLPPDAYQQAINCKTVSTIITENDKWLVGDFIWAFAKVFCDYNQMFAKYFYAVQSSQPARQAILLYAMLSRTLPPGDYEFDHLKFGIYLSTFYNPVASKFDLELATQAFSGQRTFYCDEAKYRISIKDVQLFPNEQGAHHYWLAQTGKRSSDNYEIALLNSFNRVLHLFLSSDPTIAPKRIGDWDLGIHSFYRFLRYKGQPLDQVEYFLRNWGMKIPEEAINIWVSRIMTALNKQRNRILSCAAIIPTGELMSLLGEPLRKALMDEGYPVYWVDNPATVNVEGMLSQNIETGG